VKYLTPLGIKIALTALLVVAAGAALAGHPFIAPDLLAGLGAAPMLIGNTTLLDIKTMIEQQGVAWEEAKRATSNRIGRLEENAKAIEDFMAMKTSPMAGGGSKGGFNPNEETKAFLGFMRSGRELPELKAMQAGTDPTGGYLLPEQIDVILSKNLREISVMRQIASVVPVGTSELSQLHSVGGTGYTWVGETTARPETDTPTLKKLNIPTKEVYALPGVTQNLLDDNAFNLENWLVEELSEAFGDAEGDAFMNGDGIAKPRGLFTYDTVATGDATREHTKFQYVPTGASGAFHTTKADPLISLVHAVKPRYRRNASWLMNPEVLEAIRKLKEATSDRYLWEPALHAGQPSMLLGYPVYEDENVPGIAANSLSVAFGDFSRAYTITDRSTSLLRDPFTNKPYVMFYAAKRVGGGGGRDTRAVKFLKFSAS
jgi:HK97 family phage major capsid protein